MEILSIILAGSRALSMAAALASQVSDVTTIAGDLKKTYDAVGNLFSKDPTTVTQAEIDELDAISSALDEQVKAIVIEPAPKD